MSLITYIVTERREKYEQDSAYGAGLHSAKLKLERLCGCPCLVQYYADVSSASIQALGISTIIFSGYTTFLQEHPLESFQGLYDLVRHSDLPMLGLCGGHQLIAELWAPHNDRRLTRLAGYRIRKLRKGEPDLNAGLDPGYFKEWGFRPIRIVARDPLFTGLRSGFMACERHRNEIKALPKDFKLLASTPDCRVQAYRHSSRLIYGTQFHPEAYTDAYPAGKTLLTNFFRLAGRLEA